MSKFLHDDDERATTIPPCYFSKTAELNIKLRLQI